jgi:hypothetical protein
MYPDEIKIIDIIKQYAKGMDALNIFRYIPEFIQAEKESGSRVEYLSDKSDPIKITEQVEIWKENIEEFLELTQKSRTKYGFIVVAPEEKQEKFKAGHKEIIRSLHNKILAKGGIMLLIIRDQGFVLDPYIRPGADKITKLTIPEEYAKSAQKPHQVYAFYG